MNRILCGIALILSISLISITCAREGFPPGGPRDIFPPFVAESQPTSGSTEVSFNISPTFSFNEALETSSIETNIFISPIVKFGIETDRWNKKIKIKFREFLKENTTYIITLGTGIKDNYGNRMSSPYIYALSTSSQIDHGILFGKTIYKKKLTPRTYIWAYDLSKNKIPDPTLTAPDYLTQTDINGTFRFTHISPGQYRLFAFLDQNRDQKYNYLEPLGVPPRDMMISEKQISDGPIWFQLTTRQGIISLISAQPSHRNELNIILSRTAEKNQINDKNNYQIQTIEDGLELDITGIYLNPNDPRSIKLMTASQEPLKAYILTVKGLATNNLTKSKLHFLGSDIEDRSQPKLLGIHPHNGSHYNQLTTEIVLSFNEPVTFSQKAITINEVTGPNLEYEIYWRSPNTALIKPLVSLKPKTEYEIKIQSHLIKNMVGLTLDSPSGTSDTISSSFISIGPEEYGSIGGRIGNNMSTGHIEISLFSTENSNNTTKVKLNAPGIFQFNKISPAKYILYGYNDTNMNGRYDDGIVSPFLPAERSAIYPDTLAIEPGQDIREIELNLTP